MSYISPWFQAAMLPTRWNVAGIACPSISVWHLFCLENMGNAYTDGRTPTMDDAVGLLIVTTTDREEMKRCVVDHRRLGKRMAALARKLRRTPFEELDNCVLDYFKSCTRAPDHKHDITESGSRAAAPYQFHIVLCLCDHYGLTPKEAWDMPYAEARCLYDVYAETQGDKSLADARLQQSIDEWVEKEGQ